MSGDDGIEVLMDHNTVCVTTANCVYFFDRRGENPLPCGLDLELVKAMLRHTLNLLEKS